LALNVPEEILVAVDFRDRERLYRFPRRDWFDDHFQSLINQFNWFFDAVLGTGDYLPGGRIPPGLCRQRAVHFIAA